MSKESQIPPWVSVEATKALNQATAEGESQKIEFKEIVPSNGHDLAKEIAAFATSGGGKIYIGVAKTGVVIGLEAVETSEAREQLCDRIQGIAASGVVPAVRNVISTFASDDGKHAILIDVPKQNAPIYYVSHKPYLRDGALSRPATPEEVIDLVWSHGSSAHRRKLEELKEKMFEQQLESQAKHDEEAREMLRSFHETNERIRSRYIP
ncbi:MAG: putative DNA binding domain-containing protein [Pirellulales bacterium]|nr:putative DNA binding domain-containing protein [Pirellulales bacterium]